jgi:hypothetical protein
MEVSGQIHRPDPFTLRNRAPGTHWIEGWEAGRLGRPQSRSGGGGEEKNSQPLPGLEPPIIQLVAQRYTTELSRLLLTY